MSFDKQWYVKPQHRPYRKPEVINTPNCVRVFRTTPERVELQIRGENRWMCASLTFEQASQIAAALVESQS